MKKHEYLSLSQEWRERWTRVFDEGPPPLGSNPEFIWDCVITCSNAECVNFDRFWWESVQENLDGVYRVICGLCGKAVEDLDPLLEDDEDFRLNCRLPDGSLWTEELSD